MFMVYTEVLAATPPEEVLYGYGPLGVGVVALAVVGYKLLKIILEDRDKAIADRDALLEDVFTKVLPAIAANTEILQQRQILDRDLVEAIKDLNQVRQDARYYFDRGRPHEPGGSG